MIILTRLILASAYGNDKPELSLDDLFLTWMEKFYHKERASNAVLEVESLLQGGDGVTLTGDALMNAGVTEGQRLQEHMTAELWSATCAVFGVDPSDKKHRELNYPG